MAAGCAAPRRLMAQRAELITPGIVRVLLVEVEDNQITVDVFNQTMVPMIVYRDGLTLSTATGMRARMRGGVAHVYTLPPGGMHRVKVRFDLYGLRPGDQAALIFQNAVIVNGQPVPVEPLPLILQ